MKDKRRVGDKILLALVSRLQKKANAFPITATTLTICHECFITNLSLFAVQLDTNPWLMHFSSIRQTL